MIPEALEFSFEMANEFLLRSPLMTLKYHAEKPKIENLTFLGLGIYILLL